MEPVKPCKSCSCKNGDQFVPLSAVEEVLKSNTEFLWDKKSADYEIDLLINNIKQKAGL